MGVPALGLRAYRVTGDRPSAEEQASRILPGNESLSGVLQELIGESCVTLEFACRASADPRHQHRQDEKLVPGPFGRPCDGPR